MTPTIAVPYPLCTYNRPLRSFSLELSSGSREADSTKKYSVLNPVLFTFFANKISPAVNPDTFITDIVVSVAATIDDESNVVELATISWPPTALTVSFSNTAVDNVPLIRAFSTSRKLAPVPSLTVSKNPAPPNGTVEDWNPSE